MKENFCAFRIEKSVNKGLTISTDTKDSNLTQAEIVFGLLAVIHEIVHEETKNEKPQTPSPI